MEAKRVADSAVVMCVQMQPSDANPQGQVHGGTIMRYVDTAAAVVGHRHARSLVATARIDEMTFFAPVEVGDLVTLRASLNAVWHTSMEVSVEVETEHLLTGQTTRTATAYLVVVALDEHRRPREVPPLLAETPEEQRRMEEAQARRARRLITRAEKPPA